MTGRKLELKRWLPLALGLALLVAFVVIRSLSLEADPPSHLPDGGNTRELWAEWGAKAHEARNWALFGRWQVNPADNYGFWRPQAPVWVYSLAWFLKLFGVSTISVRVYSILVASAGFVLTLLYARKRLQLPALMVAGCFMAFNCYYIFYTRAGLMEPLVNLFAAATVLTAYLALSDPRWLVGATAFMLLAFFSKSSGLYLFPVVFSAGVVATVRARKLSLPRSRWLPPLAVVAVLLLAVALYTTTDVYQLRTAWTFGHMVDKTHGSLTKIDTGKFHISDVFERLFDAQRWTHHFFPLFPVAATSSLVALVYTIKNFAQKRHFDWDVLTVIWFLAALASLQLTSRTHVRYYVVLFPPIAVLGARGVEVVLDAVRRWRYAPALVLVTVLGIFFQYHGSRYANWWGNRHYGMRDTNLAVQRIIGQRKGAVVIGMWSPWLAFDTNCENYIVRNYFNVKKDALQKLGATHLLLTQDISGNKFKSHFPEQYEKKKKLKSFQVYGQKLTLYELPRPL